MTSDHSGEKSGKKVSFYDDTMSKILETNFARFARQKLRFFWCSTKLKYVTK